MSQKPPLPHEDDAGRPAGPDAVRGTQETASRDRARIYLDLWERHISRYATHGKAPASGTTGT